MRDTFPPVPTEETFADALRRIAARLDEMKPAVLPVNRSVNCDGLTTSGCLALLETIAVAAALDDVVVSEATSSRTEDMVELKFTLQSEPAAVDEVMSNIDRSRSGR